MDDEPLERIELRRTAVGRYEVLVDGEVVGEIRTRLHDGCWSWVVVGVENDVRGRLYRTKREAARAVIAA